MEWSEYAVFAETDAVVRVGSDGAETRLQAVSIAANRLPIMVVIGQLPITRRVASYRAWSYRRLTRQAKLSFLLVAARSRPR